LVPDCLEVDAAENLDFVFFFVGPGAGSIRAKSSLDRLTVESERGIRASLCPGGSRGGSRGFFEQSEFCIRLGRCCEGSHCCLATSSNQPWWISLLLHNIPSSQHQPFSIKSCALLNRLEGVSGLKAASHLLPISELRSSADPICRLCVSSSKLPNVANLLHMAVTYPFKHHILSAPCIGIV
jgi:hypothetical protein